MTWHRPPMPLSDPHSPRVVLFESQAMGPLLERIAGEPGRAGDGRTALSVGQYVLTAVLFSTKVTRFVDASCRVTVIEALGFEPEALV
jgi:hypothetical protein